MQRARRLDDVAQHTVDTEAHDRAYFVGFEVDVGRALAQRLQQERVDHPDHRSIGRRSEQILCLGDVLQQSREVRVARQIFTELCFTELGRGRRCLVVCGSQLGGKALGADPERFQRPLQHALELGDALDRCIVASDDQYRVAFVAQWENAVAARKRVRHGRSGGGQGNRV